MEANVLLVLEVTMTFAVTLGRFLLGLYFFLPGISKITGYTDTLGYMTLHNIPLPEVLLPITIVLQVAGGLMLMMGIRVGQIALTLAALTLIINLGMHDFWNVYEGVSQAHETQNFVKNLAILAGLLVLSGAEDLPQHRLFGSR
jgi:putative oxidoreductase